MTHNRSPKLADVMSRVPVTIDASLTIGDAQARMFEHNIRHLPVTQDGHLVGVISDRDVAVIEGLSLKDRQHTTVGQTMSGHVYTCEPTVSVKEVVAAMAERKLGTAIVMENGKLAGIFTTIDAMRLLVELLD